MAEYEACFRGSFGGTARILVCSSVVADASQAPEIRGEALRLRGLAYSLDGEHDLAIRDLTEAIRLSPESYKPVVARGFAYFRANSADLGASDLRRALPMVPPGPDREQLIRFLETLNN